MTRQCARRRPAPSNLGRRQRLVQRAAALTLVAVAVSGCAGPFSTLDAAGPSAASVAWLWWVMFWGSVAILAGMVALGAWVMLKPGRAAAVPVRRWIVHGGLVFPSVVVLALLIAAFAIGERLIARPLADPPMRIEAHARQWVWEFTYPEVAGAQTTLDVVHLPAGRPVDIVVTSGDVIHSFWIPRLGGKIDAIPGHENLVRLQADRPGRYGGLCAEFCGDGHSRMRFAAEAHEQGAFEAVVTGSESQR